MNIFSNYFLLAANVASKEMNPNADAEWAEFMASITEETNSDTGKNNHKLIIASIGNQVMSDPSNVITHSMARANLNKSVWLVTNTNTASKYIPRRTRISIN